MYVYITLIYYIIQNTFYNDLTNIGNNLSASSIYYDDSTTQLGTNTVQGAIELVRSEFKQTLLEHKTYSGTKSYGTLWAADRGTTNTTITFPKPFVEIPTVTVSQCTAGSSCSTKALSITQSSFIIQHSYVGYGEGASHNVSWTAQGYVSKI